MAEGKQDGSFHGVMQMDDAYRECQSHGRLRAMAVKAKTSFVPLWAAPRRGTFCG